MKKKSVVALLTATMVIGMTGAGCGDKQLALATAENMQRPKAFSTDAYRRK